MSRGQVRECLARQACQTLLSGPPRVATTWGAVQIRQVDAVELPVHRTGPGIDTDIALVVSGVADADQPATMIEQPATAASIDRGTSDLEVGKAKVLVVLIDSGDPRIAS